MRIKKNIFFTGHSFPTSNHTFGLYSALRACRAIALRSNLQSKLTVETMFLMMRENTKILRIIKDTEDDYQDKVAIKESSKDTGLEIDN